MTRTRVESSSDATGTPATVRPAAPEGVRTIRVCWGEEVIQPVQYNGVRVGPLEVVVEVPPGKDPTVVYDETWAWLDALAKDQYRRKMTGFLLRLTDASNKARAASRP